MSDKKKILKSSFLDKSLVYLFPVLMLIFFLQALGLYSAYTPLLFSIYYIVIGFISYSKINYHNTIKNLFLIWIVYILVSGITANLPTRFITEEFKRFIAPTMFVFVGMFCKDEKIYKTFLYSIVASIVIGFVLLIFQPSWYVSFLIEAMNNQWYSDSSESVGTIMQTAFRFQSFFSGPYAISYFATFSMCIILCDIYKKNRMVSDTRLQILIMATIFTAIVMSGFRIAISYILLSFVLMLQLGIYTKNRQKRIFIGAFAVIVVIVGVLLLTENSYVSSLREKLLERFLKMSYESAMEGSRTTQQEKVLDSWQNVFFGDGTGSKGAQARIEGLPAITDGGYVKMLVENGILGISLFAMIMLLTLRRGLKNLRYYITELLIIGYMLASLLGANSLAMHWCYSLMFWFSVGRIWNQKVLEQRKLKSDKI